MSLKSGPIHIMEIRDIDGRKEFFNKFDVIDSILLQSDVINRKIVIMSIIGEYRKGKSFFLGYCLRFMYANYASVSKMSKPSRSSNWMGDGNEPLSGFSWKHGFSADTKGILFWPDVFLHDDDSGEKIAIIIMDTQGLFEIGSTQEENARIFGLSTLISSVQIINTHGVMREDQIEYLEMATSLTKIIADKQLKLKNSPWKPFQKLLFLIRDWSHEDIEGGYGYGGGSTYFEEFLNSKTNEYTKASRIRKNVYGSFDEIECFLLNAPGKFISSKNFMGEWAALERDFVNNLKVLIESILSPKNLIKKSILGRNVNCSEFRDYIFAYLKAFRDTKLPEVENILQMTIDNQMKSIVAEQLKAYQAAMNENIDLSRDDFESWIEQKHKGAKRKAISGFSTAEKLDDEASKAKHEKILSTEIENNFVTWRESIIREYQRYRGFKKQMDHVKFENSKYKEIVGNLEADIRKQTQESAKIQQDFQDKMMKQNEQSQQLKQQVEKLNLKTKQKETELKIINEKMESNLKENEEKFNLQKKKQQQKFDELERNYTEKMEEYENVLKFQQEKQENETKSLLAQIQNVQGERERDRENLENKLNEADRKLLEEKEKNEKKFAKMADQSRKKEDKLRKDQERHEKLNQQYKAKIEELKVDFSKSATENREKTKEYEEKMKEQNLKAEQQQRTLLENNERRILEERERTARQLAEPNIKIEIIKAGTTLVTEVLKTVIRKSENF